MSTSLLLISLLLLYQNVHQTNGIDWKSWIFGEHQNDRSSNKWINYNTDFAELRQKVFGQHIAVDVVTRTIAQHLNNDWPSRALVLSFHGYTGIGKSYLANLTARAIYPKYRDTKGSRFVHKLQHSTYNRAQDDKEKVQQFRNDIEKSIVQGERSLFILEEVDKYPPKFLDNLISYLESSVKIKGKEYDSRKAIFLLISDTGGKLINNVMKKLRSKGIDRSQISYWHFEELIDSEVLIQEGGLKGSELVSRAYIDRFVPFLPLEREHVKQCAVEYLRTIRKYPKPQIKPGEKFIAEVADQIAFIPADSELFSRFGCRRVPVTVDTLLPPSNWKTSKY